MAARKAVRVYHEGLDQKSSQLLKPTGNKQVLQNVANIQRRPTLKRDVITKGKSNLLLQKKHEKEELAQKKVDECTAETLAKYVENVGISKEDGLSGIRDIDEDDYLNLTLCAEYVKDIYKYLHRREKILAISDYMPKQTELTSKMRTILIDWLVQVHQKFTLLQETLYLTVYIIDRFLDKHQVSKSELQLVGVTAMLLASKYEEMYAPEMSDFVYITDNAYSKNQIKSMEQVIMNTLDYDFSNPMCIHFLRRISKAGEVEAEKHILAKYLMELTLINYEFSQLLPSQIAAAALYISLKVIDLSEWTPTLNYYSGYTEEELLPVVSKLAQQVLSMQATNYDAIKNKYSTAKLRRVSLLPGLKGKIIKRLASLTHKSNE